MEAGRRDRQGGVRAILPWPCAPCANCSYWGVRGGFLFFIRFYLTTVKRLTAGLTSLTSACRVSCSRFVWQKNLWWYLRVILLSQF